MLQDEVLHLLKNAPEPLSGESMSRALGVSRAAVWKAVTALREKGYTVEALPARGYRLAASPDILSPGELADPGRRVGREVICLDRVDSTNDECKRRAMTGAPDGLVITAGEQTRGKGRRGRSFQSPAGQGLYLSALLRPQVPLAQVSQLTAWSAVAVCRAVEAASGLTPGIKWTNDVILGGRKLCGILTELGLEGETGSLDYVVVGIGVNIDQREADFGPELSPIATSLALEGAPVRRAALARAILGELDRMYRAFPDGREDYLAEYRRRCLTVGREVRLIRPRGETEAFALGVDDDFALRVRLSDGGEARVEAGEVSVRGLLGYV